jgi:hypothetical protein
MVSYQEIHTRNFTPTESQPTTDFPHHVRPNSIVPTHIHSAIPLESIRLAYIMQQDG